MIKKITVLFTILLAAIMTACGNKPVSDNDLMDEVRKQFGTEIGNSEEIEDITIDKRQTSEDEKTDKIWITISTVDADKAYKKGAVVTYGLYNDGWNLDNIKIDSREQWDIKPLRGISEDKLKKALYGQGILIGNDKWVISEDNLADLAIIEQNSDLDNKSDEVKANIKIDDVVETAEGEVVLKFDFSEEWKLAKLGSSDDMAASMKEDKKPDITEDEVIAAIGANELQFKGKGNSQYFSIKKDEVSDFIVSEPILENKGTKQVVDCEFNVNKPLTTLKINATVSYIYQDGWNINIMGDVGIKPVAVNITGEWNGEYIGVPWNGTVKFNLETTDDNYYSGEYSWISEGSNAENNRNGGYEVSGTVDLDNLIISLEAGDWIELPDDKRADKHKYDVTAEIKIGDSSIKGKGYDSTTFTLTK